MKKITFFGDIMCEPTVLKGAKKGKSYDFNYIFSGVQSLLKGADYRVGNLTLLCSKEMGYCDDFADFGCPDTMADALKNANFDLLSTANNHSFDRRQEGLVYTIEQLDKRGLAHTGTFLPGTDREEAYYLNIGDMTVAVICYTYNTNFTASGKYCKAEGEYADSVNLLHDQEQSTFLTTMGYGNNWFDKLTKKVIKSEKRGRIKHFFGINHTYPKPDDRLYPEKTQPYVDKFTADIQKAKEKADFVIFYPHIGGQFDPHPGAFTEYIFDKALEAGADAIIASHAHVVQKALFRDGVLCAYSLGNFNMDPCSGMIFPATMPAYGLALHLYMEDKKLKKATFSLTVARKEKGKLVTRPAYEVYPTLKKKQQEKMKREIKWVVETVTRKPIGENFLREEYEL